MTVDIAVEAELDRLRAELEALRAENEKLRASIAEPSAASGWALSHPTMVAEALDYLLAQHFDFDELAPDSRKEIAEACAKPVDAELARLRRLADARVRLADLKQGLFECEDCPRGPNSIMDVGYCNKHVAEYMECERVERDFIAECRQAAAEREKVKS